MCAAVLDLLIIAQGLVVLFVWAMHPILYWDATRMEVEVDRTFFLSTLLLFGMLVGIVAWAYGPRGRATLRKTYLALIALQALLALFQWFPHYRGCTIWMPAAYTVSREQGLARTWAIDCQGRPWRWP
jgi:cbb3-type cytochrome oxidase subunit 3